MIKSTEMFCKLPIIKTSSRIQSHCRGPAGYDRTRNAVIGNKDFDLTYLEEAYTSEHWLVRIYRVKKPDEFNRPVLTSDEKIVPSSDYITKKVVRPVLGLVKLKVNL